MICKAFLRPLIDYRDTIYDKPQNDSFFEKLESIQYITAVAITVVVNGITWRNNSSVKFRNVSKVKIFKPIKIF